MMRDRDAFAMLFPPRCLGHRFRELDGLLASQCRSRILCPRIALSSRPWRTMARCPHLRRPGLEQMGKSLQGAVSEKTAAPTKPH